MQVKYASSQDALHPNQLRAFHKFANANTKKTAFQELWVFHMFIFSVMNFCWNSFVFLSISIFRCLYKQHRPQPESAAILGDEKNETGYVILYFAYLCHFRFIYGIDIISHMGWT